MIQGIFMRIHSYLQSCLSLLLLQRKTAIPLPALQVKLRLPKDCIRRMPRSCSSATFKSSFLYHPWASAVSLAMLAMEALSFFASAPERDMIADTSVSALIFLVLLVKELVFDASSKAAILSLTLAATNLLDLIYPGVNSHCIY